MPIIKAYTLPHPPLAISDIGQGREKGISRTLDAFDEAAIDIASIAPETIIIVTPHGTMYEDHFHISPGRGAGGDFSRFGAPSVRFEVEYDEELLQEITNIAENSGISAGAQGERDPKLDHGVMVPMWFINKRYKGYKMLRISQSGMSPAEHYLLGQIIAKASDAINRKAVFIGSSDLSHKLSDDGPYGYVPEGEQFDKAVTDALSKGDFLSLLNIPVKIRDKAAECGYNSLMVLAGLFDKKSIDAKLISYEGPFGVGYAVAGFTPVNYDENRNILELYFDALSKSSIDTQNAEDDYQKLARQSLEHIIETGEELPVPNGLPIEMMNNEAGVFVSLHKNGRLRGCIGTIKPTKNCIAEEIIQNAISAGLSDPRFSPVEQNELQFLTYKVDVLSPPEKISSPDELDVKRYGVIVSNNFKRGLLLPNLDGVDTVEDQIDIAKSKAGISDNENYQLERFEVIRHE